MTSIDEKCSYESELSQIIDFRQIEEIQQEYFDENFAEIEDRCLKGDVFVVRNNAAVKGLKARIIDENRGKRGFFRENTPLLYDGQLIQKALFGNLRSSDIFVESYLRFRRTVGEGAFVGPHVDQYESLPVNGLNCWVSFSDLDYGETITLLPATWHPDTHTGGAFKWGVKRLKGGRLMPLRSLVEDARTFRLDCGDYVVFNSGRIVHCSPFFVKQERITVDIRIVKMRKKEDLHFRTACYYYHISDLGEFDSSTAVDVVLERLWAKYDERLEVFPSRKSKLCRTAREKILEENVRAGMEPLTAIMLYTEAGLVPDGDLVDCLLSLHPRSVTLRRGLLKGYKNIGRIRVKVGVELLRCNPENPTRLYVDISENLSLREIYLLTFRILGISFRSSIFAAGLMAIKTLCKLRQAQQLTSIFDRLISSTAVYIARHNHYVIEGQMKTNLRQFKRAQFAMNLPGALRQIYVRSFRVPNFGWRAENIVRALEYIRVGKLRGRNRLEQVAEFGVAAGEGFRQLVILLRHFTELHNLKMPTVYGFDSFDSLHKSNHPADIGTWEAGDYPGDFGELNAFIHDAGWADECKLIRGYFGDSLPAHPKVSPDFILIDCDYYTSTFDVFECLKERLESGTIIYFDDLGTNHFNRNLGEERLIHEVNSGRLGDSYHLHHIFGNCYIWSDSNRPIRKKTAKEMKIPLKKELGLSDFY